MLVERVKPERNSEILQARRGHGSSLLKPANSQYGLSGDGVRMLVLRGVSTEPKPDSPRISLPRARDWRACSSAQ